MVTIIDVIINHDVWIKYTITFSVGTFNYPFNIGVDLSGNISPLKLETPLNIKHIECVCYSFSKKFA